MRNQPAEEKDAGTTIVQPATTPTLAAEASAPPAEAGPPAWAMAYDDKADLAENAGDTRCKDAPAAGAKPGIVSLEVSAKPPALDLSIPSLGVKQRIWSTSTEPGACTAKVVDKGKSIRFHCGEEQTSIDGKIYTRRSDVALGRAQPAGTGTTKFLLPCGTPPKLEIAACPKECKKETDACTCGNAPAKK